jgi:hypothetical protein
LCLLLSLTACATEKFVPVPEIVEVPGPVQWREIPAGLTEPCEKTEIPDGMTYGQALEKWAEDRAAIDTCNGRLAGIDSLGADDDGN